MVNAPADFTVSGSPASQSVVPGGATTYGVTITPSGGFTGPVTLSVSGLPTGATGSFAPNPATASSTLTVTTTASTPIGTYPLTLTGVSGSLTRTATVSLVVLGTTITVTAPNTAVTWQSGTSQDVTFTHNLGVGHLVNIHVSRDGGASWALAGTLTTTAASSGTYVWLVGGPPTQQARIRVSSASVAASDMSDVNFSISPRVTVTAPNTAVTWGAGSTRTITWTHNLGVSQAVDITFSPDNGATWIPIASGVPNATATTGTYTGQVPAVVTTQGRVRVSWSSNSTESDTSDGLVTLAAPAITVTAPNTNVSWVIGSARSLTWTHNLGTAESIKIELSRDAGSTWSVLVASSPNTASTSGTFNWTVTGPATATARVRITWTTNGAVQDISDVNFRVTSPIAVTAPNTAVTWGAGSLRAITWTHSLGAAQTFDIDFSANNGVTWVPMASNVPGGHGDDRHVYGDHAHDPDHSGPRAGQPNRLTDQRRHEQRAVHGGRAHRDGHGAEHERHLDDCVCEEHHVDAQSGHVGKRQHRGQPGRWIDLVHARRQPPEYDEHLRHVRLDGHRPSHDVGANPRHVGAQWNGARCEQCELPDPVMGCGTRSTRPCSAGGRLPDPRAGGPNR